MLQLRTCLVILALVVFSAEISAEDIVESVVLPGEEALWRVLTPEQARERPDAESVSAGNLLINPSFEIGDVGFAHPNVFTKRDQFTGEQSYNGRRSCRITAPDTGRWRFSETVPVGVRPGGLYTFSIFAMSDETTPSTRLTLAVLAAHPGGIDPMAVPRGRPGAYQTFAVSAEWQQLTFSFVAGPGAERGVTVYVWPPSTGTVYLDTMSLKEGLDFQYETVALEGQLVLFRPEDHVYTEGMVERIFGRMVSQVEGLSRVDFVQDTRDARGRIIARCTTDKDVRRRQSGSAKVDFLMPPAGVYTMAGRVLHTSPDLENTLAPIGFCTVTDPVLVARDVTALVGSPAHPTGLLPERLLRKIGVLSVCVADGGPTDRAAAHPSPETAPATQPEAPPEEPFSFVGLLQGKPGSAHSQGDLAARIRERVERAGQNVRDWLLCIPSGSDDGEGATGSLQDVREALRAANPEARLVVPCGDISTEEGRTGFAQFLESNAAHIDVVGFTDLGGVRQYGEHLDWLTGLIKTLGLQKPVWNVGINGPSRSVFDWWFQQMAPHDDDRPAAADAAAAVVKRYVLGRAAGVERVLADFTSDRPFTLTDFPSLPTAQALALGATAGRLAEARFVSRSRLAVGADLYLFSTDNGAIAVLWAQGDSPAPRWLALDPQGFDPEKVRVLSYYGGTRAELPRRPIERVAAVDEDPVLVLAEGMTVEQLAASLDSAPLRDAAPGWLR